MTKLLCFLDFETRSKYDIKYGAWAYTSHESTEVICAAVKYDQYYEFNMFKPDHILDFFKLIKHILENNNLIIAHNAFFEYCVLFNILHKRFGFPEVTPEKFRCTAAMASLSGLPRKLSSIASELRLTFNKDPDGYLLMKKMCKPRKPTKKDTSIWIDSDEDINRLMKYCMRDVIVTESIYPHLEELKDQELKAWLVDFKMNVGGIHIDTKLMNSAMVLIKEIREYYKDRVTSLVKGDLTNINSVQQITKWVYSNFKITLPSLQKEFISEFVKNESNPKLLNDVLKIRLALGKSSVAKVLMFDATNCDNRIRGCFLYHGAFTGRWAGRLIQPQNLPQGSSDMQPILDDIAKQDSKYFIEKYKTNSLQKISDILRGLICAPDGKSLLVSDYKAIESRVILWLAQDKKSMEKFKNNKDLYIEMASHIYNCDEKDVTKEQRSLGKTAILGLGYGMGVNKFLASCKSNGIDIDEDFAKEVVKKYREKYSVITNIWHLYEQAFIKAYQDKKYCSVGKICFNFHHPNGIAMTLPSGRKIFYRDCKLESYLWNGKKSYEIHCKKISETTGAVQYKKTWGGELVQNATQAVARDIIADAMVNLDKAGFAISMTVHDEIVAEDVHGRLKQFCDIMKQTPAWAKGLPLEVEGWSDSRYHK